MTTYTSYSDMRAKLEQLQGFRGRSATAVASGDFYIVSSYDKPILILYTDTRFAAFNNNYYDRTTSRLQNLIKDAFGLHDCKERKIHFM